MDAVVVVHVTACVTLLLLLQGLGNLTEGRPATLVSNLSDRMIISQQWVACFVHSKFLQSFWNLFIFLKAHFTTKQKQIKKHRENTSQRMHHWCSESDWCFFYCCGSFFLLFFGVLFFKNFCALFFILPVNFFVQNC